MPATTRSANKQAKLEDVGAGSIKSKPTKTAGQKRKASAPSTASTSKAPKKAKPSQVDDSSDDVKSEDVIIINRAPVLELWAACVTQFLHPSVSWDTSLSMGGAIATITAISKGRSIGKIDKPDPGEVQKKREERKEKAEKQGLDELEVMSFNVNLDKNGHAMVSGKPKNPSEETLSKKYGGSKPYEKVKKTFQDALNSWKDREDDLNQKAFKFYEIFRPNVKPGQQGWGRKGQLNLQNVRSAIADG